MRIATRNKFVIIKIGNILIEEKTLDLRFMCRHRASVKVKDRCQSE